MHKRPKICLQDVLFFFNFLFGLIIRFPPVAQGSLGRVLFCGSTEAEEVVFGTAGKSQDTGECVCV